MELRVEAAEGCSVPGGCYVGVRIGETLKQGRYEPTRCYNFPQVDRRRNAKIDLYQHVGTCTVAADPEAKSTHDVAVTSTDPSWQGTRLKVSVQAQGDDSTKKQREARVKALKSQANDYLSKHGIEERLSEAVKALLKEQPADPTEFLCRVLRGDDAAKAPAAPPPEQPQAPIAPVAPPPEQQSAPPPPAAAAAQAEQQRERRTSELREQAAAVLMKASEDGELLKVLEDITRETQAADPPAASAPAYQAPAPAQLPAAPAAVARPPPRRPAMLMSSVSQCGPAFHSMGMRPAMLFV